MKETEKETKYDPEGIAPLETEEPTYEEWTADGCTPSYGCSQCKYFDECPEGQYMF